PPHLPPTPPSTIDRILTRLPRFLHPYTTALRTAPISHLTSFLILHEITAIVPLVGLATTFHYAGWLPETWVQGRWVNEGVERFGRYFGRRGFERGTRILVEVATAYAITKVLLPVRVLVSVWGAPWFARAVLGRFGRLVRWRGRGGGGGGEVVEE
ncbi:hypothetical protein BKA61DRAFT_473408, partial [Leptodontidium sp. MPI-SDFR-AT-0119]